MPMPSLLRKSLVCFYCGCRSAQRHRDSVRAWKCDRCEAVNYLDENGHITDPPTHPSAFAPSDVQYARVVPRSASPLHVLEEEELFCPTCIKNQHVLTQTLATYLPALDDPTYSTYENSLPAYRESLEQRYPQVCLDCEPRVRRKIRAAGYVAKTDHLRRMMEQTRISRRVHGHMLLDWRELIVLLGGLGWWISLFGHFAWGLLVALPPREPDELREETSLSASQCLCAAIRTFQSTPECAEAAAPLAEGALLLGLFSIWWNNQLRAKLRRPRSCLTGLSDYYKLQVITLMTRALAWSLLRHDELLGIGHQAQRGAHMVLLAFLILSTGKSLRAIKNDVSPRILFHAEDEPLVASPSMDQTTAVKAYNNPQASPRPTKSNVLTTFPIEKLATRERTPPLGEPLSDPLTPPAEDDALSVMDWTPTVDPFQPNSRFPEPDTNGVLSASSFSTYQRLPPAPKGPAAKLRNPTRTAPFFQASSENQQTMFGQLSSDSVATPLSRHHSRVSENLSPVMKAPRFFPVADYRADTGLEGLFDAAFSLRDEPVSIGSGIEKQVAGSTAPDNVDSLRRLLMAIALSCSLLTWKIVAWSQSSSLHLHIGTISISIIIATRAYFSVQNHQIMGLTDWSGTIIGGLQLACAIAMFAITVAGFGSYELIDLLGSVSLGGMIAQELWMLASGYPLADGKLAASLDTSSQQDSGSSLSFDSKPISQTQRDSSDRTIGGGDRSRTRSPAKQGRVTRSTSQRESYIPSTRLSGMSLGDSSMNKAFSGSPSLRSQKLFPSSATAAAKAQRGAHKY